MSFYHHRNAVSAQAQATGLSLQIGSHIFGWCRLDYRERPRLMLLGVVIWSPIHNGGQRLAFSARIGRARVSYWTRDGWSFHVVRRRVARA